MLNFVKKTWMSYQKIFLLILSNWYRWLLIFWIVAKIRAWFQTSKYNLTQDYTGKNVVLTGATKGTGKFVATQLAKRNASLYIIAKDMKQALQVRRNIISASGNDKIEIIECDLADSMAVRWAAERIEQEGIDVHSVLCMEDNTDFSEWKTTIPEGPSVIEGTNFYGHFLLINLLMRSLKKVGQGARIIIRTSEAHRFIDEEAIDWDNFSLKQEQDSGFSRYRLGALFNIMFTKELAYRIYDSGITVNCVHPGYDELNYFTGARLPSELMEKVPFKSIIPWILWIFFFMKSKSSTACPVHHLIEDEGLAHVSGHYFTENTNSVPLEVSLKDKLCEQLFDHASRRMKL